MKKKKDPISVIQVRLVLSDGLDTTARNSVFEKFLATVDGLGLQFGGGGPGEVWEGFVEPGSADVTEAGRDALVAWLDQESRIEDYTVGPVSVVEQVDRKTLANLRHMFERLEAGDDPDSITFE